MKKIFYTIVAASLALGACHPTYVVEQSNQPAAYSPAPVQQEVSYQNFYDELSPYGHWIDYPGYGYVWMPAAGPDFRPYATNGYWLYTDMGWTWTSNYSWGWAPFHYGRWFYEGGYGWMWMPGNEWSPAWVSWRSNNDYYGWAPLGPNVRVDNYGGYNPPSNYWCFVPHQYISNPRVSNYYINDSRNVTIINNTTIINTRVVNVNNSRRTVYGPDRQEVERVTGSQIRPAVIRENNRPGEQVSNGQYTIYRPRVNSNATRTTNNTTTRVAPSRVESLRDVRPASSSPNSSTPANNNSQPVIRNSNNNLPPANNNNNAVRPTENVPAPVTRPSNVNNNPPVNNRVSNSSVNNANQPANTRPINTRPPVNDSRPANANTRTPAADNRPANNNVRTNAPTNNPAPANNYIRNNSSSTNHSTAPNTNKNASQVNQMRKTNATNPATTRPVEKKDKKDE